jgi:iron complex transport system ATP-binding protein
LISIVTSLHFLPRRSDFGLIGPNAAGKSTLFKCVAGLLSGRGNVEVDGRPLVGLVRAEVNRLVAFLPQENPSAAVLTVFEAVLLARQNAGSWRVSDDDLGLVGAVLEELGVAGLALRYLNESSGGQKQLVSIAQALVRAPRVVSWTSRPATSTCSVSWRCSDWCIASRASAA